MFPRFAVALGAALLTMTVHAASDREQQLLERIQPVGQVCVEGDQECASQVVAAGATVETRSGEDVYGTSCGACHSTGLAGAPRLGEPADWETRAAQGMDAMVANAINGIRGMPPRGTCMNCSDEEIRAAVEHMVPGS